MGIEELGIAGKKGVEGRRREGEGWWMGRCRGEVGGRGGSGRKVVDGEKGGWEMGDCRGWLLEGEVRGGEVGGEEGQTGGWRWGGGGGEYGFTGKVYELINCLCVYMQTYGTWLEQKFHSLSWCTKWHKMHSSLVQENGLLLEGNMHVQGNI